MLQVREIMTAAIVSVTSETSIRDAIELLATKHLSGAPVVTGGRVVGVVSATDLLAFLAELPGVPTTRSTENVLEDNLEVSADEAESDSALQTAFFADLWDDAGADASVRFDSSSTPEWDVLAEHDVSEVMTRGPLHTVGPDDSAEHAARLMQREGIHRVLVVEGDRLVGIVSSLDITKAAADDRFSTRTYLFNHDQDFGDRVR